MAKAVWKGAVIAESDRTQVIEGNHYFPPDAVVRARLRPSASHTVCSWKGTASYYDVVVDGEVNADAAWYYPEPKSAASSIAGWVAFWRGVTVEA
jgi:uncharacterized protein (DUF427 family)